MNGNSASPILTANALEAVHVLLKPYKYFRDPTAVKESAPPELEAIVQQLLTPAFQIFHLLVEQAVASHAEGSAPHDALLHTLCKCFHHTIQSYLPQSLLPSLPGESKLPTHGTPTRAFKQQTLTRYTQCNCYDNGLPRVNKCIREDDCYLGSWSIRLTRSASSARLRLRARVYPHDGPIGHRKRGYIITMDQSDALRHASSTRTQRSAKTSPSLKHSHVGVRSEPTL
eukprot:9503900-Pyramimonas_sp.AAC.1